jgi:hypothetical protein
VVDLRGEQPESDFDFFPLHLLHGCVLQQALLDVSQKNRNIGLDHRPLLAPPPGLLWVAVALVEMAC